VLTAAHVERTHFGYKRDQNGYDRDQFENRTGRSDRRGALRSNEAPSPRLAVRSSRECVLPPRGRARDRLRNGRRPARARPTRRGGARSPLASGSACLLQRGPCVARLRRNAQLARENRWYRGCVTSRARGAAEEGEDPCCFHLWIGRRRGAHVGQRRRSHGNRPGGASGPSARTSADSGASGARGQSDDLSRRRVGGA